MKVRPFSLLHTQNIASWVSKYVLSEWIKKNHVRGYTEPFQSCGKIILGYTILKNWCISYALCAINILGRLLQSNNPHEWFHFCFLLLNFQILLKDLKKECLEKWSTVFRRGISGLEHSEQKRIFVYLGWLYHETVEPELEPLSGRIHSYSSGNLNWS